MKEPYASLAVFFLIFSPILYLLAFNFYLNKKYREQKECHKKQLQELDQLGKAAVEEAKKNKTI